MQIIKVRIERGLVDIEGIEPGTIVKVYDYDTGCEEGPDIYEDDDGNTYHLDTLSSDKPGPSEVEALKAERDALLEELLVLGKHVHTALSEIDHKCSVLVNIDVPEVHHKLLALHDKVMHARYGKTDSVPDSDNGPR